MEKIGYFRILPRELILELQKYFARYFEDKSIIFLDAESALAWQLTQLNTYLDTYEIEIHIRSPVAEYNDFKIPFNIQYETIKI